MKLKWGNVGRSILVIYMKTVVELKWMLHMLGSKKKVMNRKKECYEMLNNGKAAGTMASLE